MNKMELIISSMIGKPLRKKGGPEYARDSIIPVEKIRVRTVE